MGVAYSHDKTSDLLRIAVFHIEQRRSACRLVIAQHYNATLDALKIGTAPLEAYDHAKICQEQMKRVQLLNVLERHCCDIHISLRDLPNTSVPPPHLAVPMADVLFCAELVEVPELPQICRQLQALYHKGDVIQTYRKHASTATQLLLNPVHSDEPYALLNQILTGPQPPARVDLSTVTIKCTDVQTSLQPRV
jgi:hypothetical protein